MRRNGFVRVAPKMAGAASLCFALLVFASAAFAAGGGGDTLGKSIQNVVNTTNEFPLFLGAISYVFGLVMGVFAISKIIEHVTAPQQVSIWESVKRIVAAGAFFALPTLMEAVITTVSKGFGSRDEGSTFNTPGASGVGLDAMMIKFMGDIWQPTIHILSAFGWIAGIILVMVGISRLLKTAQDGPRGPGGFGTMMTFLTAGALMSLNPMLAAFGNSLFADGKTMTYAKMNYKTGMDAAVQNHAHTVISALLAFVMILGMISFIRGFFILRDHADGNQQASLMAGMTHLIGGVIAVNLGSFINVVQATLGLTQYGITFAAAG